MNEQVKLSIPDHVSEHLVYDFDFYDDPRYQPDIHDGIAQVIAEAPPVFFTPRNGGHWVLAGHAALFDAVRNPAVFSSSKMALPPLLNEPHQVPIYSDPPEHAPYRAPLNKAFSPRAMMALQDDVRALANRLIDKVIDRGECDFAEAVAEPLPVSIFLKLMGLPLDKLNEYRKWVRIILGSTDVPLKEATFGAVIGSMSTTIQERMSERREDLISTLLDTEIDGRSITFEEMQGYCLLLFIAGLDTVMNGMCFGVRHLARDAALQVELRAHPERITDAMEEMLRRYTFTIPGRVIKTDHEAYGAHFKAGDRVLLLLPAGDLDPKEFIEPMRFDLNREHKVHMAFNAGPHRCVGSHLARIEMRILYEEWLKRVPPFRLDPDRPPTFHGGHVLGCDSLHLLWEPK